MKIDHKKNFYSHSPPDDSRRVVFNYKGKYVHKVLINRLVKFALEKSVVRGTDHLDMTITVDWEIKPQAKQKKKDFIVKRVLANN